MPSLLWTFHACGRDRNTSPRGPVASAGNLVDVFGTVIQPLDVSVFDMERVWVRTMFGARRCRRTCVCPRHHQLSHRQCRLGATLADSSRSAITFSIPYRLGRIRSSLFPMPVCGQYHISFLAFCRWRFEQRAAFEEALTMRTPSRVLTGPFQNAVDPTLGWLRARRCLLA